MGGKGSGAPGKKKPGSGRFPAAPCGTNAAYQRHRKKGEDCAICKAANTAYHQQRRGSKPFQKATKSKAQQRRERNQRHYAIVAEWKLKQGNCPDCGLKITQQRLPMIDCDHRDPAQKSFTISYKIGRVTPEELLDELAKCDAVCRNCHAMRTHKHKHHLGRRQPKPQQPGLFDGQ
jgi:hypothetical protein